MNARDRRALTAGVAIIGAVLLAFRILPAARAWSLEGRRAWADASLTLAAAERVLRDHPEVADSTRVRAAQFVDLAPLVFGAGGAASLSAHVSRAARESQVQLEAISISADSATASNVFRSLRVAGVVLGDVRGLTTFVAAIESRAPLVVFREVVIDQSEPAAPPVQPERLRMSFWAESLGLAAEALGLDPEGGRK